MILILIFLKSYDDEAFWEEICQLIKNEQIFTFSLLSKVIFLFIYN